MLVRRHAVFQLHQDQPQRAASPWTLPEPTDTKLQKVAQGDPEPLFYLSSPTREAWDDRYGSRVGGYILSVSSPSVHFVSLLSRLILLIFSGNMSCFFLWLI